MHCCKQRSKQFANHHRRRQRSSFNNNLSRWCVTLIAGRRISRIMGSSLPILFIGVFRTLTTIRMASVMGVSCPIRIFFRALGGETLVSFSPMATFPITDSSLGMGLLSVDEE